MTDHFPCSISVLGKEYKLVKVTRPLGEKESGGDREDLAPPGRTGACGHSQAELSSTMETAHLGNRAPAPSSHSSYSG